MKRVNSIQIIGVLANLGVVVGLVVLIYEVNQNTTSLRNAADIAIASIGSNQASLVVEYPDFAEIWIRAKTQEWSSFSPVEQERLSVFWSMLVDRLELQFILYARNAEVLDHNKIIFPESLLYQATFRSWWKLNKGTYHPDFVIFFENLMTDRPG